VTLQEYLIKLGFAVDEPSLKKFASAVTAVGGTVAELGGGALAAAAAIEEMTSRIARNYESLYYVSQRTGRSVQFIQATQFGFKQIGLSAEEATDSIEGMSEKLRTQPWLKAIFGGADTPQKVAGKLAQSGLPYFLQVKFAEMIGMSEKTLFHMQKFGAEEAKFQADFASRQRAAGFDPDDFAKKAVVYGRVLNTLESDLEIYADKVASDFLSPTQKSIKLLDEFVQWLNNGESATKGLAGAFDVLIDKFELWAKASKALMTKPLKDVSKRDVVGSVDALGDLLGFGGSPFERGSNLDKLDRWLWHRDHVLGNARRKLFEQLHKHGGQLHSTDQLQSSRSGVSASQQDNSDGRDPAEVREARIRSIAQKLGISPDIAMAVAMHEGFNNFKSTVPGEQSFGDFQLNMNKGSLGDQFLKEIGLDPRDPKNEAMADAFALSWVKKHGWDPQGKGFHGATNSGIGNWEGIDRTSPQQFKDQLSESVPRGDTNTKNVTLHAKTDIHINGGGPDVTGTAKQYTDAHNDVNDNLIRNLQGVVR
jgi:hypothetical protein